MKGHPLPSSLSLATVAAEQPRIFAYSAEVNFIDRAPITPNEYGRDLLRICQGRAYTSGMRLRAGDDRKSSGGPAVFEKLSLNAEILERISVFEGSAARLTE